MEVKVHVDGVPRVVCGVTDSTTCQEVVIALAQALSEYTWGVGVRGRGEGARVSPVWVLGVRVRLGYNLVRG